MALQFIQKDTFDYPVTVLVPNAKGKHDKQRFTAVFKRLGRKKLAGYVEAINGFLPADTEKTDEFLCEVWVGWKDVSGEDGRSIPFNTESRDNLIDIPYVATAVSKAYFAALGGTGSRSGN